MEERAVSLVREFSELEPFQKKYTLTFGLQPEDRGCRLSVRRSEAPGGPADHVCVWVPAPEKECRRMLQFLYENAVQPQLWLDTITCWYPQSAPVDIPQEGGVPYEL